MMELMSSNRSLTIFGEAFTLGPLESDGKLTGFGKAYYKNSVDSNISRDILQMELTPHNYSDIKLKIQTSFTKSFMNPAIHQR